MEKAVARNTQTWAGKRPRQKAARAKMKIVKERVAKRKERSSEGEMIDEEGAEPSASEGEAGAAPPLRRKKRPTVEGEVTVAGSVVGGGVAEEEVADGRGRGCGGRIRRLVMWCWRRKRLTVGGEAAVAESVRRRPDPVVGGEAAAANGREAGRHQRPALGRGPRPDL
uniref:Uncharacterized protein n=1 Tax=Oryza sativa subsp. japonica TaxID=39947 RepID=Q6EP08_ORYSJ|nr:hypothetical protein [Oryza sativa Japonica Group]